MTHFTMFTGWATQTTLEKSQAVEVYNSLCVVVNSPFEKDDALIKARVVPWMHSRFSKHWKAIACND